MTDNLKESIYRKKTNFLNYWKFFKNHKRGKNDKLIFDDSKNSKESIFIRKTHEKMRLTELKMYELQIDNKQFQTISHNIKIENWKLILKENFKKYTLWKFEKTELKWQIKNWSDDSKFSRESVSIQKNNTFQKFLKI